MAIPYRGTCTIDDETFEAFAAEVVVTTSKDEVGLPEMGTLLTSIRLWCDLHDPDNMPFSRFQKLYDLANIVTKDKIKDMQITFWRDENKENASCSFSFRGWISTFRAAIPLPEQIPGAGGEVQFNQVLYLELEPAINEQNYKEIQISN